MHPWRSGDPARSRPVGMLFGVRPAWRCGSAVIEFAAQSNSYSYSVEDPMDSCLHVAPSPPPPSPPPLPEPFDYDLDPGAQLVPGGEGRR